jgi:hypothetical protein
MLNKLLSQINPQQQGFIALIIGVILLFGALGKLGIFQDGLNIIMVIAGAYLLLWGLNSSHLLKKISGLKK